MTLWKPTAAEKKAIRGFAARSEKLKPGQITMQIGERYSLINAKTSTNVLLVDSTVDWDDSDLRDKHSWADLGYGIPLTEGGRAVVDFYVYERAVDGYGDLLTNVQAHVAEGKLWKITGTMVKAEIVNEELAARLAHEPAGGF